MFGIMLSTLSAFLPDFMAFLSPLTHSASLCSTNRPYSTPSYTFHMLSPLRGMPLPQSLHGCLFLVVHFKCHV